MTETIIAAGVLLGVFLILWLLVGRKPPPDEPTL